MLRAVAFQGNGAYFYNIFFIKGIDKQSFFVYNIDTKNRFG